VGYSARYHAASLAAVFLALAVGLLIGAEFGDEVVSGTASSLEKSLSGDLDEANARINDLQADLDRQERFAQAVYPSLVGDTLPGRSLAVVALGNRPDVLRDDILEAIEPTGAKVTQVAVVREPPDAEALRDILTGKQSRSAKEQVELAGKRAGRALVDGRNFYEDSQEQLLSTFSGKTTPVDGVILVRDQPDSVADDPGDTEDFETSFIDGMVAAGVPVVGVERTDADPSSVDFFDSKDLTTVDDIDLVAGGVAMTYALRGAQGNYGVGGDTELVPSLLRRPGATTAP
jgi:hypothetical protein